MPASLWVRIALVIIPIEGLCGLILNFALFLLLCRSYIGSAARAYRISCIISAVLGIYTSALLIIVVDVPIMANGSFAGVLYGKLLFYFSDKVIDFLSVAFFSQVHTMWQMIPAPSILQLLSLTKPESGTTTRLCLAYSIPVMFHALTWKYMWHFIPSDTYRTELANDVHALHGTNLSNFHIYGMRMIDKKSVDIFQTLMIDVLPSYSASYAIFVLCTIQIRRHLLLLGTASTAKTEQMQRRFYQTQIAQVLLPLVLLSLPLGLIFIAAFTRIDLNNLSFLMMYSLWLTPSLTASLLLAFVVKTAEKNSTTRRVSVTRGSQVHTNVSIGETHRR